MMTKPSAQNARDLGFGRVDAQPGARDAPQTGDDFSFSDRTELDAQRALWPSVFSSSMAEMKPSSARICATAFFILEAGMSTVW